MARILPWNIEREPPAKKPRATAAPRVKQEKLAFSRNTPKSDDDEKPATDRGRGSEVKVTPKSSREFLHDADHSIGTNKDSENPFLVTCSWTSACRVSRSTSC